MQVNKKYMQNRQELIDSSTIVCHSKIELANNWLKVIYLDESSRPVHFEVNLDLWLKDELAQDKPEAAIMGCRAISRLATTSKAQYASFHKQTVIGLGTRSVHEDPQYLPWGQSLLLQRYIYICCDLYEKFLNETGEEIDSITIMSEVMKHFAEGTANSKEVLRGIILIEFFKKYLSTQLLYKLLERDKLMETIDRLKAIEQHLLILKEAQKTREAYETSCRTQ